MSIQIAGALEAMGQAWYMVLIGMGAHCLVQTWWDKWPFPCCIHLPKTYGVHSLILKEVTENTPDALTVSFNNAQYSEAVTVDW